MKSKSDTENTAGGGCPSHGLFGFLFDFRERQVNHASFWYGFLQCLAMVWVLRWVWEGTGFAWWRVPLVIMACIAAKWCQSRHPLKCDPNSDIEQSKS